MSCAASFWRNEQDIICLVPYPSALIAGMEDRDPYWARPWHSAISMAEEILERPELVRGKTVVDVG